MGAIVSALTGTNLVFLDNVNANTNKTNISDVGKKQFSDNTWQIVKQSFRLHLPKDSSALSQIIIDTPPTVAVSNDIDVLDDSDHKIDINISVSGRRIIIAFPKKISSNTTTILVNLNKVKQPTIGIVSIYRLSAKVVGSEVEIPVGIARFRTD